MNSHAEHVDPEYSKNHEKARLALKKGEVFAGKPGLSVSRRMLSGTALMTNEIPLERRQHVSSMNVINSATMNGLPNT